MKDALNQKGTNNSGTIDDFIHMFPASECVKDHLHGLFDGSGTVTIQFDNNATKWSVVPIQRAGTAPAAAVMQDERMAAAKLEPRAFEQYRLIKQMDIDHELADKKLKQETELAVALADRANNRDLALADKITKRELALADKTTERERELAILAQQAPVRRPRSKTKAATTTGKRRLSPTADMLGALFYMYITQGPVCARGVGE